MSNPTGDALVAIGVRDTQKLSGALIHRALCAAGNRKHFSPLGSDDARQITLGILIGVILLAAFLM